MFKTIISKTELAEILNSENLVIIDCRFSLVDTDGGRKEHAESHIPSAQYAHLDDDLSSPIIPGKTGRHPLPTIEKLTETFSNWGIDDSVQVVAYDQGHGGIAARLWWLLNWLGHENVAVLDGGWAGWTKADLPTSSEKNEPQKRNFIPQIDNTKQVPIDFVDAIRNDSEFCLIDSRTAARYRGENEPIDPIAGHIPGAISAPFPENLDETGHFLSKEKLRERFENLKKETPSDETVFYCGSGVTACHNLLALKHAELGDAKLFVGSWSGWIADGNRPIA